MARGAAVGALERVEATPDQRQRIGSIVDDTAVQLLPMRETHRGLRQDFVDAMLSGSIDPERLEALRQQHLVQHDEASGVLVGAIAEVASVLTPEQRQELYDMRPYRLR